MQKMLITVFNDASTDFTNSLIDSINIIPGIENLKYQPNVINRKISEIIVEQLCCL